MSGERFVSGDWLDPSGVDEKSLMQIVKARVLSVERNEYSLVLRFSNGAVLTVSGGGQDGSALDVEVERDV